MGQLTVPVVFDHDDLQRLVNEKIAEVKAQFISKADYKARLRADMAAMLDEISLEIDEMDYASIIDCQKLIREKINALKEPSNDD